MMATQFLVERAMSPVLLGPWEKGETATGPTPAEREQWVRRSVHGTPILTVTPVTWLPIERSGRKERQQVSRLSVDMTSLGGPCSPGSARTPAEAFRSADVAAKQAGCLLIGSAPPETEVTPSGGTGFVFAPAEALTVPQGSFSSVTAAADGKPMRAWGSVGAKNSAWGSLGTAGGSTPEDLETATTKLLMFQGGRSDDAEGAERKDEKKDVQVIDVEPEEADPTLSPIDVTILTAIRDLTVEEAAASGTAVTEMTGLDRTVVRATLRRLHKEGRIAPVLRPKRPEEPEIPGVPELAGMAIEGWRLANDQPAP
jgi:hypothetical protein